MADNSDSLRKLAEQGDVIEVKVCPVCERMTNGSIIDPQAVTIGEYRYHGPCSRFASHLQPQGLGQNSTYEQLMSCGHAKRYQYGRIPSVSGLHCALCDLQKSEPQAGSERERFIELSFEMWQQSRGGFFDERISWWPSAKFHEWCELGAKLAEAASKPEENS